MNTSSPSGTTWLYGLLVGLCMTLAMDVSAQIKKGKKLMEAGAYEEAIKPLKKEFYTAQDNTESGILLAKCFYTLRKYPDALDIMQAINIENVDNPDDRRLFADILVANDDFSSAYVSLISLLSEDQSDPKTYLWLDKVSDLLKWDSIPTGTKIQLLSGVNTVYNDYAPFFAPDGDLYFITDANTVQAIFPNSYSNQSLHLYYKTRPSEKKAGEVDKPSMLMRKREYYYHDGPMDYWPEQKKYALTLREIGSANNKLGIYFSDLSGKEEALIPFQYNENYNTGHPVFSRDGKRMIFSSDRPGGFGQMDLWYTDWADGSWSRPVNMGPIINTPFNEVFPRLHNLRLYFSSDRTDMGYGALDLYYTSVLLGYDKVYNLRAPVNSAYDDFAPAFKNDKEGYFSSNRRGGNGGDDIYGLVYHPVKTPAPLSRLQFEDGEVAAGTPVEVRDETGNVILTAKVNKHGAVDIEDLTAGEIYSVSVGKEAVSSAAHLQIMSASGKPIGRSVKNQDGTFNFEVATTALAIPVKNPDYEEPKYEVNGKIIADQNSSVGNIPVSLVAPGGSVLATTTTAPDGTFKVAGIEAGEAYTIRTDGLDAAHEIDIYGKTGAIEQSLRPIGNNRFAYTRALPPAAWMAATTTRVVDVHGTLSARSYDPGETVTLFDERDSVISHPEIGSSHVLSLGTLETGKAYRLNFLKTELTPADRLYLLGSSGDTAQTVRPFDTHNYFFEYMLNSDFGGLEFQTEPLEDPGVPFNITHKMKIQNYDLGAHQAFVLRKGSDEIIDTLYSSKNGVIFLYDLEPNVEYQLMVCDTTFATEKPMKIYDAVNNHEVASGESENKNLFVFTLLGDADYLMARQSADDGGVINYDLRGRLEGTSAGKKSFKVYDFENNNLLWSGNTATDGAFLIEAIPARTNYVIQPDGDDPAVSLAIAKPDGTDSLRVMPNSKGNFVVHSADLTGNDAEVVVDNRKEVSVARGANFKLPEVYYAFNSYYLKADSRASLDKLYNFLQENPKVKIEINSYTDSRGPDNYNMLLSQRRAESVVKYLTNKGISPDRMRASGKGETDLKNKCKDGVPCTEAEHAVNRRTSFSIIKTVN